MSGRHNRRLRKYIKERYEQNVRDVWAALVTLPFRRRARLAWMLLLGRISNES